MATHGGQSYDVAQLQIQDEPEFPSMAGMRRFIHWEPREPEHGVVFLFYVPQLKLYKLTTERFEFFKPKVEALSNTFQFTKAIEANQSCARTNKIWDGGPVADGVLNMLKGKYPGDDLFLKAGEPDKPVLTPEMTEAPAEATKHPGEPAKDKKRSSTKKAPAEAPTNEATEQKEDDVAKKAKKGATAKKAPAAKGKGSRSKAPEGKLVLKVSENPRKAGTNAGKRFNEMFKYVKGKRGGANVADVLAETSYRIDDLNWDIAKGNVEVKKG